uniref:Uncharacterized protein n=1 Tax=Desertifilum tharense IPPAS B-1220 TaxID=1781255 RepID=A0ACD5GYH1_9CYAN
MRDRISEAQTSAIAHRGGSFVLAQCSVLPDSIYRWIASCKIASHSCRKSPLRPEGEEFDPKLD